MDDPRAAAGYCPDCWEEFGDVHRPLSERYALLVERESRGRVTAYRCPHSDSWHLDVSRLRIEPSTLDDSVAELPAAGDLPGHRSRRQSPRSVRHQPRPARDDSR